MVPSPQCERLQITPAPVGIEKYFSIKNRRSGATAGHSFDTLKNERSRNQLEKNDIGDLG
ncbi:MAG: hypothetical protein VR65_04530 [Desulfobulbaceae bacterium BRH_c16a]|nr:MAG: hypothetical protein VR65_04530 [Desulfobulbaceae bacterium BRH_c16a]